MKRRTRQSTALEDALNDETHFRSAQQIHASLVSSGEDIGLATVYRQLQRLADDELVDTLRSDAGEVLYRRCETDDHHHHIVCRQCGRAENLDAAVVESWVQSVEKSTSFVKVDHTVELFGLCATCSN